MAKSFLILCLVIVLAPSLRVPSEKADQRLFVNYGRSAALDLDWLLLRLHADPESLAHFGSRPEGEVQRIEPGAGAAHLWIWRQGEDLIVGIDENGDAQPSSDRPDSIEDMIVVDYASDGTIDRLVDWQDTDGDAQADRQILYALTPAPLGGPFLSCIIVEQRDRVRGFWHLERWQYTQSLCQWRSDFSGNIFHVLGRYDERRGSWHSHGENPFCFYDPDEDGLSEEALLLVGDDTTVRHIRWSFDADHDASESHPYDYDLSLTAHGRRRPPLSFCDSIPLRGHGKLPVVRWDKAREFARSVLWRQVLLTVDEDDRNVDPDDPELRERWEGVIADIVPGFPSVGSPGCGRLNKRYELNADGGDSLRLYISWADERLHLFGAQEGWIRIDEDGDRVCDAVLRMEDRNQDGFFDTWLWDEDGDDVVESVSQNFEAPVDLVTVSFGDIERAEKRLLDGWRRRARSKGGQAERFWSDVRRWRERGRALD